MQRAAQRWRHRNHGRFPLHAAPKRSIPWRIEEKEREENHLQVEDTPSPGSFVPARESFAFWTPSFISVFLDRCAFGLRAQLWIIHVYRVEMEGTVWCRDWRRLFWMINVFCFFYYIFPTMLRYIWIGIARLELILALNHFLGRILLHESRFYSFSGC